jgi:hypothetical protein
MQIIGLPLSQCSGDNEEMKMNRRKSVTLCLIIHVIVCNNITSDGVAPSYTDF